MTTKTFMVVLLTNVTKYVGNWPVNNTDSLSGIYTGLYGQNTGLISKHPFNNTILLLWICLCRPSVDTHFFHNNFCSSWPISMKF